MRFSFALGLCLVLVGGGVPANAALTTLRLAQDYSDFCIHPVTGDVAAISLADAHVHLFRSADLAAGKKEPYAKIRVGSTPCSICFKLYDKLELFAVTCEKDSYLYLIDAKTGALHRKVELPSSQVFTIAASLDPNDPLLFYYCAYRSSGVVSLKDYKYRDLEFFEGGVDGVSARGDIVYINASPHEFRYTAMSLIGDDSTFRLVSASENKVHARGCLPDPYDRFVALGSEIYTRALEKREAELNFTPLSFLRQRPLLFGVVQDRAAIEKEKSCILLQAASYNTFTTVGKTVVLEPDAVFPAVPKREGNRKGDQAVLELFQKEMPRGMPLLETDRDSTRYKLRLLADEARNQIVVAYRSRLDFVPLAEFDAPAEPLLLAKLDGATAAFAGREWTGALQLADQAAQVEFSDLPTGMKAEGLKLKWTPTSEQIGPQKFGVTLKHKDMQRLLSFEVDVSYPSLALPFLPTELGISPDGSLAMLTNAALGRWQRQRGDNAPPSQPAVALLDLKTDKILATKKLGEALRFGRIVQNAVVMIHQENPERCEIFNTKNLAREKTITAAGPIESSEPYGKLLLLHTLQGLEFYDTTTWQLVRRFNTFEQFRHEPAPFEINSTGLNISGVQYDFDLKPVLIQKNYRFSSFNKHDEINEREIERHMLRMRQQQHDFERERPRPFGNQREREIVGTSRETRDGVTVDAVLQLKETNRHAHRDLRQTIELLVTARGQATGSQLLARQSLPLNRSADSQDVLLELSDTGEAFVAYDAQLYRWAIPKAMPEQAAPESAAPALRIVPRQSALALGNAGQTVLKHEVQHGSKPYKFSLTRARPGMTIDEKTGVITLDDALLRSSASAKFIADSEQGQGLVPDGNELREAADAAAKEVNQSLGLKLRGFPFAIPIEVTVQDAQNQESTLNYYVMTDIPLDWLVEKFNKLAAERKAEAAKEHEHIQARLRQALQQPAGDLEAVLKRIDALEQRLDLTTRQLNQVLKLLDEKNAKP